MKNIIHKGFIFSLYIFIVSTYLSNSLTEISRVIMLIFFISHLIINKEFKLLIPKHKATFILYSIFFLLVIITSFFTENIDKTSTLIPGLIMSVVYLLIGIYLIKKEQKTLKYLMYLLIIFAVISSIYGLLQYYFGFNLPENALFKLVPRNQFTRVFGLIDATISFGIILVCSMFVTIYAIKNAKTKIKLILLCIAFYIISSCIIPTGITSVGFYLLNIFVVPMKSIRIEYTSIILIIPIIILCIIFYFTKCKTSFIIAILVLLLIPQLYFNEYKFNQMNELDNIGKSSFEGRVEIWKLAIEKIKEKPLLGHGMNTGIYELEDRTHYTAHNTYIEVAVSNGIPSAIILLFTDIFILINAIILFLKTKDTHDKKLILLLIFIFLFILSMGMLNELLFRPIFEISFRWITIGLLIGFKEVIKLQQNN